MRVQVGERGRPLHVCKCFESVALAQAPCRCFAAEGEHIIHRCTQVGKAFLGRFALADGFC